MQLSLISLFINIILKSLITIKIFFLKWFAYYFTINLAETRLLAESRLSFGLPW